MSHFLPLHRINVICTQLGVRFLNIFICLTFCFSSLEISARPGAWGEEWSPESAPLVMQSIERILVPALDAPRVSLAIEDLKSLMLERYGKALRVIRPSSEYRKRAIILKVVSEQMHLEAPGGYVISRKGASIVIEGKDPEGLANGIYGFLQDILGARWYWDSSIGFQWVGPAPRSFPDRKWDEVPAFIMRNMYPMEIEFARRNRLISRYHFNHALAKIFTKSVYASHPEAFSIVNGRRVAPKGSGGEDPQPNFAETITTEIAADAALEYFSLHPEALSFSLSTNDNVLFDQSAETEALVTPLDFFRGKPNYTDMVFAFNNAVAERVFNQAGQWENAFGVPRYLPSLAYYWTEQSPTIPVHPRVMPILTSDRAQWHDPAYRAEDKALISRWADSGADVLATWDYYFGAPYPYPRQFNQWIAESIPYLYANNVRAFFSQLPTVWGMDGAKAWLASRLLWDPSLSSQDLLEEYYTNFFGTAAEPMRAFYEFAEAYRNVHTGPASWIKYYKNESGILFNPAALREMRAYIDRAEVVVAEDPIRAERVQVVSDAFTFTEKYAKYEYARRDLVRSIFNPSEPSWEWDMVRTKNRLDGFIEARAEFEAYAKQVIASPMHSRLKGFVEMGKTDPVGPYLLSAALNNIDLNLALDSAYTPIWELAQSYVAQKSKWKLVNHNVSLMHGFNTMEKRDFIGPAVPNIPQWEFNYRHAEHTQFSVLKKVGRHRYGVRISGIDALSVYGDFPAYAGKGYLLNVEMAYQISSDNRTQIRFSWRDAKRETFEIDVPLQLPFGPSDGTVRVAIPVIAPEGAESLRVQFILTRFHGDDFLELHEIELLEAPE